MRGTDQAGHVWVAAVGVALLLSLTACSGEADEVPTEPSFVPVPSTAEPEPSDSPSAEPSAPGTTEALVAPELPAAATEETPEGAAAFAEWWFETLNYATATGDTTQLAARSDLEICETCSNLVGRIDDLYSSGGRITGGEVEATVEAPTTVNGGIAAFVVHLDVAAATQTVSGAESELPPGRSVNAVATAWRDGWIMGDLRGS